MTGTPSARLKRNSRIQAMRNRGHSYREIADLVGLSLRQVQRIVEEGEEERRDAIEEISRSAQEEPGGTPYERAMRIVEALENCRRASYELARKHDALLTEVLPVLLMEQMYEQRRAELFSLLEFLPGGDAPSAGDV